MKKCVYKGNEYLLPDIYLNAVINKLDEENEDYSIYSLKNIDPYRNREEIELIICDERYTGRFIAHDLEFTKMDSHFSLLSSSYCTIDDHNRTFISLLKNEKLTFRVLNISVGAPILDVKKKFKLQVCGLGDVGGTMLEGLRLLAGREITEIGIYDRNEDKKDRWYREANQILRPDLTYMPPVKVLREEDLFTGDVFIFCVTAAVPGVGQENSGDVRLIQFEKNAAILESYVKLAGERGYKGDFFIVSDPVDQLCMHAHSLKILRSQQIRGFGLGVMYARAIFHARELGLDHKELKVYGPHGNGLLVLNSLSDYDVAVSDELTDLTRGENLAIRKTGFKPYVGPALSSGAISILRCLKGDWHYSSTLLDGIWFGAKNMVDGLYTRYECLPLMEEFHERLAETRAIVEKAYHDAKVAK